MAITLINTMTVVLIVVSCRSVSTPITRASQLDYRVTLTGRGSIQFSVVSQSRHIM
jgi:hypothetical protein